MRPFVQLVVVGVAGALVIAWWTRGRRPLSVRAPAVREDLVELCSRDSFPASDPPSWTHSRA